MNSKVQMAQLSKYEHESECMFGSSSCRNDWFICRRYSSHELACHQIAEVAVLMSQAIGVCSWRLAAASIL